MKCYIVDLKDVGFYKENSKNAASKPRTDVEKICMRCGFEMVTINSRYYSKEAHTFWEKCLIKINAISIIIQSLRLLFIRNSIVIVQYPFLNHRMRDILSYLKKHNKIIVLYHDLYSLRLGENKGYEEWLIKNTDVNIVHSEAMKEQFLNLGSHVPIVVLEFFDYLTNYTPEKGVARDPIQLVYAGNFSKSKFIHALKDTLNPRKLKILLYGLPIPKVETDAVEYKGTFESEQIESVEGNWGLVWDGDSIDGCTGDYGDYLRVNAPFKMSLYLAMGIPVVVWSKSAMARYIKDYHLGITVDSINDIFATIESLSTKDVQTIEYAIRQMSFRVRNGKMLEHALKTAKQYCKN